MSADHSRTGAVQPPEMAALIDACSDGIIVYDFVGTILWHNETALRFAGAEPGTLVGQNGTDYIHPEDLETASQRWLEILTEPGKTVAFEQRLVGADDIVHWCDVRMQNRLDDPAVNGVVCYFHDLTELREAEEKLRRTHRQDVATLLAGQLAHDFNNLLTTILGNSDLVLFKLPVESSNSWAHEQIRAVRQAAEQAAELTRRLLTFSRHHLMHRQVVDLVDLVEAQLPILQTLIPERVTLELGGDLSRDPGDRSGPNLGWVDRSQFEQVLLNLVANARDAVGSEPATIAISLETVVHDEADIADPDCLPGEYTVLSVSDTGEGIPSELLPRLFEAFVTTKPPGQGTGLGLTIVGDIARESRGFVTIDSTVGEGTTVSVHVPRYFGELVATPPPSGDTLNVFGEGGVMVVDDDPGVLRFVDRTLTTLGYDVYTASSYDQALRVFAEHRDQVDLCLLDSVLPSESGQELAREFTKVAPIPVVMMSGYVRDPGDDLAGVVTDLLSKPFGVQRLGQVVKRTIRSR